MSVQAYLYTMNISERGFKNTSIFSTHTVKTTSTFCHSTLLHFQMQEDFFFFISLLKFILQQHPHYTSIWLSNIAPSYDKYVKTINGNTDHFYSMQFTASYSRKFLNLIIIHTLKKAKSYYLCQSNRNKCIEGLTCLPKDMLPEIFLSSHPTASATELACLTIN